MSRLIETIRVSNGRIENLSYHLRRMQRAGLPKIDLPSEGVHKLRIVYDTTHFEYTISPYTIRPIRSLKLVFDNNIVYDRKYEDRTHLERLAAQRDDCDEVLIVKNGMVTDTSYSNIIFRKDDRWFTPASFLLNGTMRQYLLDNNIISEVPITPDDIRQYSHFKPINAMLREDALESEVSNIR